MSRLSGLQEGMLFHGLYDGEAGAYIEQFGCRMRELRVEVFVRSWEHLMRRHSILRSGFWPEAFGVPVQVVYGKVDLPVEEVDLRVLSAEEQVKAIEDYEHRDRQRGFDFGQAPLMRIGLLQTGEETYWMVWTHHHMLLDGWSLQLLLGELLETYEGLVKGEEPSAGKEDRYEEYIRYIMGRDKEQEERYWRGYLGGLEGSTLLPFIGSTGQRNKGVGEYGERVVDVGEELSGRVRQYAQGHRLTVNTVMQGVWSYLLHRYSGRATVVYGVTVSGRPEELPGMEERIGLYINTLPMYSRLEEGQEIVSWLKGIQEGQVSSRQYQYSSLSKIQGWVGVKGDLFDSLLVFDNYPVSEVVASRQWALQIGDFHVYERGNYPLGITIGLGARMTIKFNYNKQLLSEYYIEMIEGHFAQVLEELTREGSGRCLRDVRLLTAREERQLMGEFNATETPYDLSRTVVELFGEQAARTPEAVAVVYGGEEVSYGELDRRSNQLGQYLRERGVGVGVLVPLCVERSVEMVIGILGILKAGGAYVPIDPEYPVERIGNMLEDIGPEVVVTTGSCRGAIGSVGGLVVELDGDASAIGQAPAAALRAGAGGGDAAYVIYTSGSTGRPKGVVIEHGSLINYLLTGKDRYRSADGQGGMGSFAHLPFTFDASVTGIFLPLLWGKAIVIGAKKGVETFEDENFQRYAPYDFIKLTPGHLSLLEKEMGKGKVLLTKKLVLGGEALQRQHFQYLVDEGLEVELINEYGPTEATVGCCMYRFETQGVQVGSGSHGVWIGQPMDNVQVYILDGQKQLCATGIPGELYIGGAGVGRGYLNQPELTAERFVSNEYGEGRLYRTGDKGRWLADGHIEFLGRVDEQVKIRGYRVEPGEVESELQQMADVSRAVVIAREDGMGSK
ncbi:MAG: amino acid adenylation domain-containing protein, partial [Variovorax sp.]|nr:amino acid adenylation domain-containing protein [Variovorax sp.]